MDQNLSLRLRIHDQATTRLTEDATWEDRRAPCDVFRVTEMAP